MKIGIYSSVPQSGKTTVTNYFVGEGFKHLSLGDSVKQSLLVVLMDLGVKEPMRYLWGDWKDKVIPELGVTGGYLMSTYATDYFRDTITEDVWLNILLRKIRLCKNKNIVVDDIRFLNEYDCMDVVIYVVRQSAVEEHGRSTKSEGNLDKLKFDYIIVNDGTFEELKEKTRLVYEDVISNYDIVRDN